MNKIAIAVDHIHSYQTLVYKNGNKTFPKAKYTEYKKELYDNGMKALDKVNFDNFKVSITFYCKNKLVGDMDNITKPILDTLEKNKIIKNDRYINELYLKKVFGYKENTILIHIEESCDDNE